MASSIQARTIAFSQPRLPNSLASNFSQAGSVPSAVLEVKVRKRTFLKSKWKSSV